VYTHKKGGGWRIIEEGGEDTSKMLGENCGTLDGAY